MTETEKKAETEKKITSYAVFRVVGDNDLAYVQDAEAPNDLKAIAAVSGPEPEAGASFVAIPKRSLRKRTVSVVSEPKIVVA